MDPKTQTAWMDVCNPGYFGAKRDKKFREFDRIYGKGNWRIRWKINAIRADFLGACALYEDAYFEFLRSKAGTDALAQLITEASDVYDDALTNMASGHDYSVQETDRTHVQDIAIRRALLRLGLGFMGKEPIQIRDKDGTHPLSMTLSPGRVPFHWPALIHPAPPGRKKPWWNAGSVEDFYQNNKVLQANVRTHDFRASE